MLSFEILNSSCVGGKIEGFRVEILVFDPADQFIRHTFKNDINIVFVVEPVFKYFKLKHTDNADDHFLHAAAERLKNLDGTFLCDLRDTFYKLLSFHGIFQPHSCKVFGSKGGDTFKLYFLAWCTDRIADRENTRVEYADNVACIGFINDLPVLCHELLRLGKAHFFVALYMIDFHGFIIFSRAYPHKCNSVTMCFIHVCLDFKNKGRKMVVKRVNLAVNGFSRQRRRCHSEELRKERFDAEIGKG